MAKQSQRPQPAGWDKTVKLMLKPEHVERLSDTQVRITLPPVPDFDIEEDETIEVWIPATAVASGQAIYAGSFTIKADSFEDRIDHAIVGLKEELDDLGPNAAVARFLLTFVTCEVVAKSLVSHSKSKGQGRKALIDKWTTKDIGQALKGLGIHAEKALLDLLFSTEKAVANDMSARLLRDNLVHRMKRVHRVAIRARLNSLLTAMQQFLTAVQEWRSKQIGEAAPSVGGQKAMS